MVKTLISKKMKNLYKIVLLNVSGETDISKIYFHKVI